ncbi:MAG: CBS domain-containing protein [Anaerolineae bacterium]|nr:CBS domain-containing protein [Anaerolineae bacterium]
MPDTPRVRDWMTPDPIVIQASKPLPEAHQLMKQRRIRRLPVVDRNGRLVGIVTRGDVREASPSNATSLSIYEIHYLLSQLAIEAIMTRNPRTVTPDTLIKEAARQMLDHKISGLPVVEGDKLVGIITESDIFRGLIERL